MNRFIATRIKRADDAVARRLPATLASALKDVLEQMAGVERFPAPILDRLREAHAAASRGEFDAAAQLYGEMRAILLAFAPAESTRPTEF